jgi:RHS repeat-associated protein
MKLGARSFFRVGSEWRAVGEQGERDRSRADPRANKTRRATALHLAAAVAALVALVVSTALAASDQSRQTDPDPYGLARNPEVQRALSEQHQAAERRRSFRASAEGQSARAESRGAYRRTTRHESLAVAQDKFGEVIGDTPLHGLQLHDDEHLLKYLGDSGAIVEHDGDNQTALVASTFPLRTEKDGSLQPTDLRLEQTPGGFETINSPLPVVIGTNLSDGVRLPGLATIEPVQVAPGSTGQLVSGKVFFANAAADTDLWVAPQAGGAEIFTQIRSPEAPDVQAYDLHMPAGSTLRMSDGVPDAAEIVRDGKVIASAAPPVAVDADGERVPMSYRVEGDRLLVKVAHSEGDYRYPILADPLVADNTFNAPPPSLPPTVGGWGRKINPPTGTPGWGFDYRDGAPFGRASWGTGLWIWDSPGGPYATGNSGEWLFEWNTSRSNSSFIGRLDAYGADFDPRVVSGSPYTCVFFGMWSDYRVNWDNYKFTCIPNTRGVNYTVYGGPTDGVYAGTAGNHATMLDWTSANSYLGSQTVAQVDRLTVWLSDAESPTLSSVTHSLPPTQWGDAGSRTVTATAQDSGLGIKHMDLRVPSTAQTAQVTPQGCSGLTGSLCPTSAWTPTLTYGIGGLQEGTGTSVSLQAFDAGEKGSALNTWGLRIDHSNPSQGSWSGDIAPDPVTNRTWVRAGSHTLTHSPSDTLSGVQSDTFGIGGSVIARDSFTRTTVNGLGTADVGGAWRYDAGRSAADFSTNGSRAQVVTPLNVSSWADLSSVTARDTDSRVAITPQGLVLDGTTNPAFYAYLLARYTDDTSQYKIGMRVNNDRKIWIRSQLGGGLGDVVPDADTGLTYTEGATYNLRVRIAGATPTTVQAKLWVNGTPEPSNWTVSTTNSNGPQTAGHPGLRTNGFQATASTIQFDDLRVLDLEPRVQGSYSPSCTATSGCPTNPPAQTYTWDPTGLDEGIHPVTVTTADAVARSVSKSWDVGLDTVQPVQTSGPSGTLWDNRGKFIREGAYDLSASASDVAPGSGVKDIQVLVNGAEDDSAHAQQTCAADCPPTMSRTYTFNTAGRTQGTSYRVQMIAHDKAGNSTTLGDATVKLDTADPSQGTPGGDLAPPVPVTAKKWVGPGTHTLTHTPTDSYSGVMRDYSAVSRRIATDSFTRTTFPGWGSAERGGAYTIGRTGGATFSTNGTEGVMTIPFNTEESQILTGISARDVEEQVTVRFPSLTLNGASTWNIVGGLTGRRTLCSGGSDGCQNFVMIAILGDGRVMLRGVNENQTSQVLVWQDVDTGLRYAAGDSYRLRVRMLGGGPTTIQAKAWKVGSPEPAAWAIDKTGFQFSGPLAEGAGAVGLKAVSQLQGSNVVRLDDFSVEEFAPQTSYTPACDAASGCPTTAPTQTLTWDPTGQDEGVHQVLMWTRDAVQHTVVYPWNVYLDRTAPARVGTPSGTLWDNQVKFIREGSYDLHVTAADPAGGSGVKDVRVLVDGVEEDATHASQTCGDDCPGSMTRDFTFNTSGRSEGSHRIQAIARDKVDNPATLADFTVKIDSIDPSQGAFGGDLAPPAAGAPRMWVRGGSHTLTHVPTDSGSGVMRDWTSVGNPVGSDAFARTTASGWGTADRGGAWQVGLGTASNMSTDGSVAILGNTTTSAQIMQLTDPNPRDVDARVRVRVPATTLNGTTTDNATAYIVTRRQACAGIPAPDEQCQIRVGFVITNQGKVLYRGAPQTGSPLFWPDTDTGLMWTAASWFNIRVRVLGGSLTTIQEKIWKDGTAEPTGWGISKTGGQLTGTPIATSGRVGVRSAFSGSVQYDDLQVEDLTPGSAYTPPCDATSGCPTNPGQQAMSWDASAQDDGLHQVVVVTSDAVEHTVVKAWDVYLDRTLPTTSNYSGSLSQRGRTLNPGTQTLSVDAADAVSGVKTVALLVDGGEVGTVNGSCTPDQCTTPKHADFTWESGVSSGQHTITVRVTDLAGNQFDDSWQVIFDGTPPTLTLSGGLLPPIATGRNLHMEGDDAEGGVAKFEVWVDPLLHPDPVHSNTKACTPWCQHHDTDDFALPVETPPGKHTIRARVTDAAGLTAEKEFDVDVVDLLPASRSKLGLEHWFQYDDTDAGGGSKVYVNAETGNAIWHSVPIVNPGRGLSTVVNLTYNSQDRGGILGSTLGRVPVVDLRSTGLSQDLPGLSYGQAGVGFSIGVSGPTRLNEPLGGVLLAQAREESLTLPEYGPLGSDDGLSITLTDSDGTVHTFTRSGGRWIAPPGLNMTLRRYKPGGTALAPIDDKWAMTRPDGVTHFFDNLGYQTSTQDRNGNTLRYCYEVYDAITGSTPAHGAENDCTHPPVTPACAGVDLGVRTLVAGTPVVCAKRVWRVVDAGNRKLSIFYRDRPNVAGDFGDPAADPLVLLRKAWYRSAQIVGGNAGEIDHIVDHANRTYRFGYDPDGYLTDFTEADGTQEKRITHLNYEGWQSGLQQVGQDRQLTEVVPMSGDSTPIGPKTVIRYVDPADRRATVPAPGVAMRAREACGVTPRNDAQTDTPPVAVSGQDCRTAANDRETTYRYDHDGSGQTTTFRVTRILNRAVSGGSAKTATTVSDIDTIGRPTAVTDPLDTRTELTWDNDLNAVTAVEDGIGPGDSDAEASKTTLEYDKTNGTGVVTKATEYPDWPSTGDARVTNLAYQFSNGVHHSQAAGVSDLTGKFVADLTEIQKPKSGTGSSFEIEQLGSNYTGNVKRRWNLPGQQGASASAIYGAGGVIQSETDEANNTTTYSSFDDGGQPQDVVDPRGKVWSYVYDPVENVKSVIDPRATDRSGNANSSFTTTLTYDAFDRLLTEKVPKLSAGSDESERFTTRSRVFDRDGNVTSDTDGQGVTTTIDHGPMGVPLRVTAPGESQAEVTDYVYDAANRLIARVDPLGAHPASPNAGDQVGNCTGAAVPAVVSHMTRFCLDDAGRRVADVRTSARPGDPAALITSYAFDRRDNLVGMVDPKRNSGKTVAQTVADAGSQAERRMTYAYDKTDARTDQYEQPSSSDADQTQLRTHFDYDANGNRTQALPPRAYPAGSGGNSAYATKWFYDSKDQLEAVRTPSGCTAYAHRDDGKVTSVTSPRGTDGTPDNCAQGLPFTKFTTTYHYDGQGNIDSRSIPYADGQYGRNDSEFAAWKITYGRDDVGNPTLITDPRGNSFLNSFFDTGELRSTGRPSFFGLDWGGGEHSNPDPGVHYGEADSGADLQLADGGPSLREAGDRTRNAAGSGQGPNLPASKEQGKFASVDREGLGSQLPDAGNTQFEYDDEMRLTAIVDAAGGRREIGYDPQGRVVRKRWPFDGARKTEHLYGYDADGNLTGYFDGRLEHTTFDYDGYDRRIGETTPGSLSSPDDETSDPQTTTYEYDINSNLKTRTTARGGLAFHFGYDSHDRLTSERDPSNAQWTYAYDLNGNRTCAESPNGDSSVCDENASHSTAFEYDESDRMRQMTDGDGQVTAYGYDADGNRDSVVAPGSASHSGGDEVRRKTTIDYDGRGLPWRTTTSSEGGADKRIVLDEYDPNGNLRRTVNPTGVNGAGLPKAPDQTASGGGSDTDLADATWHATVRDYDVDDQLTAVRLPWSKKAADPGSAVDDPQGPGDGELHGDSRRLVQRFRRDGSGSNPLKRITSIVSPHEADDDNAPRTSYTYYDNGWPKTQSEEKVMDATTSAPVTERQVSFDYDNEGNQTSWVTANFGTSPSGRRVERTFNDDRTLKSRVAIKPQREGHGETRRTYKYGYNANRSLTGIFDYGDQVDPQSPLGTPRATNVQRDDAERERVVNEAWSGGKDTFFDYDANGNVKVRKTDGVYEGSDTYSGDDAKTTTFEYDSLNRELSNTVNPPTGANRTTTTTWWPSGDMNARTKENGTVEKRYFDVLARISQKTRDPDQGDSDTQDYEYDADGNRTKDERGAERFDPRGQLVMWTRGSKYDQAGAGKDKVGTTVTYARNDNGDVLNKVDTFKSDADHVTGDTTVDFVYSGERLLTTKATTPTDQGDQHARADYSYDDFGSVIKIETKSTGPGADPPSPPDGTSSPPVCDEVPDTADDNVTRYCFDEFERLVLSRGETVEKPTKYVYDGLDRRDRSTVEVGGSDQHHDFSYVGTSKLLSRETTGDGDVNTYDYDSQGHRLGQAKKKHTDPPEQAPDFKTYATDANGSVEGLENSGGEFGTGPTKDTYLYDPYGESEKVSADPQATVDPGLSQDAKENPFRFEGFYYDSGVKSYDMQAREYRPDTGHFLSQDRYESAAADLMLQADPLTQNRYAFAGGNPVNNVEFDGHDPHANYDACRGNGGSKAGCGRHAAEVSNQQSQAANGTNHPATGPGASASSPTPPTTQRQTVETVITTAANAAMSFTAPFHTDASSRSYEQHSTPPGPRPTYEAGDVVSCNPYGSCITALQGEGNQLEGGRLKDPGMLYFVLSAALGGPEDWVLGKIASKVAPRVLSAFKGLTGAGEVAAKAGPEIKAGAAGGATAGKAFPQSVREAALDENPSTCVFCRMETESPQLDHAIPRARGGDATLENAQTSCPHCNASKGARDRPVNPPPGYRGPWPPPWWRP